MQFLAFEFNSYVVTENFSGSKICGGNDEASSCHGGKSNGCQCHLHQGVTCRVKYVQEPDSLKVHGNQIELELIELLQLITIMAAEADHD